MVDVTPISNSSGVLTDSRLARADDNTGAAAAALVVSTADARERSSVEPNVQRAHNAPIAHAAVLHRRRGVDPIVVATRRQWNARSDRACAGVGIEAGAVTRDDFHATRYRNHERDRRCANL